MATMAKTTREGGPSFTEEELADPEPQQTLIPRRPELGEVDKPLVGTSYSQSLESEETVTEPNTADPQQPAHTMENPSNQPEQVTDSSADSTDTDGRKPIRRQSGRRARSRPVDTVDTDEDFFEE